MLYLFQRGIMIRLVTQTHQPASCWPSYGCVIQQVRGWTVRKHSGPRPLFQHLTDTKRKRRSSPRLPCWTPEEGWLLLQHTLLYYNQPCSRRRCTFDSKTDWKYNTKAFLLCFHMHSRAGSMGKCIKVLKVQVRVITVTMPTSWF